jgi:hypothetical protein
MGRVARAWHQHRNCPGGAWCAAWLTKELAADGSTSKTGRRRHRGDRLRVVGGSKSGYQPCRARVAGRISDRAAR